MTKQASLKRVISLPLLTLYGLGTILGGGIYVLLGKVAAAAGIFTPVAFLLSALIASLTALSYAELSSRMPRAAGEAVYVQQAFSRKGLSALVGYTVVFVSVLFTATVAKGFAGYFDIFFKVPHEIATAVLIVGIGALAAWGVFESILIACIITLIEVAGLGYIIYMAGGQIAKVTISWQQLVPDFGFSTWVGIMTGAFLAFYAFIGFQSMVNIAEEVENPRRNLPRGIILALLITTAVYILVSIAVVMAMPISTLADSDAPLAALVIATGHNASFISIISIIAIINGALVQMIMASRVLYGMGTQGTTLKIFSKVNSVTHTPLIATSLVAALSLVLALGFDIVELAKVTSLIVLCIFALVNLTLVVIKSQAEIIEHAVCYPVSVPAVGFVLCLFTVLFRLFY